MVKLQLLALCFFLSTIGYAACEIKPGEQVWRLNVNFDEEIPSLDDILVEPFVKLEREKRHENYTAIYFRVEKSYITALETALNDYGLSYDVIVHDVLHQLDIENDFSGIKRRKRSITSLDEFDYGRYQNYDEIVRWMALLAKKYDFVEKIKLGKSYGKKPLYMLKISTEPNNPNRPALYIDAAIHAREWISPSALMYVCSQIVSNSSYASALSAIDYYIIPIVNVDGYAYSWLTSQTRLWRKTMRRYTAYYPHCFGVDGNRNWDINFGGPGSSSDKCLLTYHGPRAESEYVVRHVANFIRSKKHNIKGLISLHSYGQQILYPYNYNLTRSARTEAELKYVGDEMKAAIKGVHGRTYENGRGSQVLYVFSGSTSDWAYEKVGIPLSYTIELRDTGTFRFELPKEEIIPTGEELMAGINVIANYIIQNYNETLSIQNSKA